MGRDKYMTVAVVSAVNILIHCIGSYLLLQTARKGFKTVQQMILFNVAITALLVNTVRLVHSILNIYISEGEIIILKKMAIVEG